MTEATETMNGPVRPTLVMAMDLGRGQCRLGFAIGAGQRPAQSDNSRRRVAPTQR
jgi:hypothetical protein